MDHEEKAKKNLLIILESDKSEDFDENRRTVCDAVVRLGRLALPEDDAAQHALVGRFDESFKATPKVGHVSVIKPAERVKNAVHSVRPQSPRRRQSWLRRTNAQQVHELERRLWGSQRNFALEQEAAVNWRHPLSLFRSRWMMVVIVTTIYCAVELPFELAFFPNRPFWSSKSFFELLVDFFFLADVWISFHTGFVHDGVVVMEPALIRRRYIRHEFAVDVVALLPFDFISRSSRDRSYSHLSLVGRVLRLSRLLRLVRVARLFRHSSHFLAGLHEGHVRCGVLLFSLMMFAHWDACLLYLSAHFKGFDADRTWVGALDLQHKPTGVKYAYAIFKALSHMLCIGYGSVSKPLSVVEVWLTIISMSVGAALFAGSIGTLTALILTMDSPSAKYDVLLADTNVYMDHVGLPADVRTRIRAHLEWSHAPRGGGSVRGSQGLMDEGRLMLALSPQLRRDVAYFQTERLIDSVPLLNGTLVRRSIRGVVATKLEPLLCLRGEIILESDHPPSAMFFIDTGVVGLVHRHEHVASLDSGSYFGEMPLVIERVVFEPFRSCAHETAQLFGLSVRHFEELVHLYPELPKIMLLIATQRIHRMSISLNDILTEDPNSLAAHKREDNAVRLLEDLFQSCQIRQVAELLLKTHTADSMQRQHFDTAVRDSEGKNAQDDDSDVPAPAAKPAVSPVPEPEPLVMRRHF